MTKNLTQEEQRKANYKLYKAIERNNLLAVKKAVNAGADVNACTEYQDTPLHRSMYKNISIAEYLLENGADPNISDTVYGRTPLHTASRKGFSDKIELLLKYNADMYVKDNEGSTPYVLNVTENENYEANNYIDKIFLSHGYIVSQEDLQQIKNNKLFKTAFNYNLFTLEDALKAGADVNATDMLGDTYLHKIIYGEIEVLKYLLEHGANPNIQNKHGFTILHKTVSISGEECPDKAELFLNYGADMYIKDEFGRTAYALSIIYEHEDIASLLISRGYIPSQEDLQQIRNYNLFQAVENNNFVSLKNLLASGASVDTVNIRGTSLLFTSMYSSNIDISIAEYLLKNGALPNVQNRDGETLLHYMAYRGEADKTKLLLRYNADMYIKDNEGDTPFAKSIWNRKYYVSEIFILNGYVPREEEFGIIENKTERKNIKERFMSLAASVQEQKEKLTEEATAAEFAYADEIIEM